MDGLLLVTLHHRNVKQFLILNLNMIRSVEVQSLEQMKKCVGKLQVYILQHRKYYTDESWKYDLIFRARAAE